MPSREEMFLQPPYQALRTTLQSGTHAMAGYAGTVSFPIKFAGTPTVVVSVLEGSSVFGRAAPLKTPSRFSGSFTYKGSGRGGTFTWMAQGPVR